MCCIISSEPTEDVKGRIRVFNGRKMFETEMLWAPFAGGCKTFCWCVGQYCPITCGCTQYCLRSKILQRDLTKYSCFQGYFNLCCCIKAGNCGEQSCPQVCLFLESCVCNFAAISASRMYVMEKYDLSSDPCDYRLIRINNCLQITACVCNLMAIFIEQLRELSRIIDTIADIFYHCVSGCMTAQVAFEQDYQDRVAPSAPLAVAVNDPAGPYAKETAAGEGYVKY